MSIFALLFSVFFPDLLTTSFNLFKSFRVPDISRSSLAPLPKFISSLFGSLSLNESNCPILTLSLPSPKFILTFPFLVTELLQSMMSSPSPASIKSFLVTEPSIESLSFPPPSLKFEFTDICRLVPISSSPSPELTLIFLYLAQL